MKELSRRNFLKGALAGSAALAVSAATGLPVLAEGAIYTPGTYSATAQGINTVIVTMTFSEDAITECKITSSGENDLLTAEHRDGWAAQIVETHGADVDAITGVTLSTNAVKEAVAEILAQATA